MGNSIEGEAAGDQSAYFNALAISANGLIVAVGAPYNQGNGRRAGHVRVYKFDGVAWMQMGIDIDAEDDNNLNGWSVAL